MKVSQNGVDLIKRFEGLSLEAYQDIAGIWTIGYGHTGADVKPNMRISEHDAENLLKQDLKPREDAVERLVRAPLNQNEFDALVSFVYNVGANAFKNSTARKRLNKGDKLGAADALTWWNKATVGGVLREVTGLTRRRAAERALFLEPVNPPIVNNPDKVAENSRITPMEEPPRRPNLAESRSIQGAAVAGGAGVAASTIGHNSAQELNKLETNIATGKGVTAEGSATAPAASGGASSGGEAVDTGHGATESGAAPGAGEDQGTTVLDAIPDHSAETGEAVAATEGGVSHPSVHEQHAVDAQVQFALMILIVLAVLYIIFSRIDDWFRFRR